MSKFDPVRVASLVSCAMLLMGAAPAQDVAPDQPIYYANCQYGIAVIFPGASKQPQTRDTRYTIPFYANDLPAREFYLERGGNRYSVTVVDFSSGPRADEAIVEQAAVELRKAGEVRYQAFADYDPGMPGRRQRALPGRRTKKYRSPVAKDAPRIHQERGATLWVSPPPNPKE